MAFLFYTSPTSKFRRTSGGDYVWKEGNTLVFDSSIGHTYINRQDTLLTFSSESQQGSDFRTLSILNGWYAKAIRKEIRAAMRIKWNFEQANAVP